MSENIYKNAEYVKNPSFEGVYMKHFYGKEDTEGKLNNVEILIVPGFQIAPHTHEDSDEYFYVVSGSGEFLDDKNWFPIKKGDAFKALSKITHAVKNTGEEVLILFSTFSPPIR
jgi:mannose-6-phosphate isomerase-like protein (cupin superfamily)